MEIILYSVHQTCQIPYSRRPQAQREEHLNGALARLTATVSINESKSRLIPDFRWVKRHPTQTYILKWETL